MLLGAIEQTECEAFERQTTRKLDKLDPSARALALEILDRFVQYEMDKKEKNKGGDF